MENHKKELFDKIDRLLKNEISEAEKQAFELQIKADPQLAKEVSLHRDLQKVILQKSILLNDPQAQDFKAMKQQIHEAAQQDKVKQIAPKENKNSDKEGGRFNFRIIGMALAAAFALLVVYVFLILPQNPGNKQSLIALYEANHPAKELTLSSSKSDGEASFEELVENFKNENYQTALALCDTYLQSNNPEKYYKVMLAKGVCELELGQFDAALETFTRYEKSPTRNAIKGTWFKALAYLRMEDIENCKKTLEVVIKDGRYKLKEAKTLLDQI